MTRKRPPAPDPSPPELAQLVLSADVVCLCAPPEGLHVLLVRRAGPPFEGQPSLPGVAMLADETLASAARRALRDKAGLATADVDALHVEQLATFDALFRDPRGRTVSVAHLALARAPVPLSPDASWVKVRSIASGSLPFDHDDVLATATERLRGKLRYSDIASHLLDETFTLDRLHACYEDILDRPLDRSNFRTKLLRIGMIEQVGVATDQVAKKGGRPPHLYRFASRTAEQRDFL